MLTIVASSTTILWATPSSASTAQRLGSACCVRAVARRAAIVWYGKTAASNG
jgi:hypothetical protein